MLTPCLIRWWNLRALVPPVYMGNLVCPEALSRQAPHNCRELHARCQVMGPKGALLVGSFCLATVVAMLPRRLQGIDPPPKGVDTVASELQGFSTGLSMAKKALWRKGSVKAGSSCIVWGWDLLAQA